MCKAFTTKRLLIILLQIVVSVGFLILWYELVPLIKPVALRWVAGVLGAACWIIALIASRLYFDGKSLVVQAPEVIIIQSTNSSVMQSSEANGLPATCQTHNERPPPYVPPPLYEDMPVIIPDKEEENHV